jgi:hypothetical protein
MHTYYDEHEELNPRIATQIVIPSHASITVIVSASVLYICTYWKRIKP